MNGTTAEHVLDAAGITLNKQVIPDDPLPPLKPSGIRLGTPAATARGMGLPEMQQLGSLMLRAMKGADDQPLLAKLREETKALCEQFPVPGVERDVVGKQAAA